ncbi:DUF309 domain-containing protein [Streptomyces albofaciens JCM 4342]|uniref:DUF309 domain-containing protein n=1 Tax=Streptomyces albofaciens TaxID=66866 RepID=UPI00123BB13F|nr:DUF309 domain-containing protein [Streptomyces albofaciens]KAA6212797.1 DUF309 domain-containing protein [Streptomyces albofaciens JCM 4342]
MTRRDEGGDPACWLDQVCPECGRISDRPEEPGCEHRGTGTEAEAATATGPGAGAGRDRDAEGRARNARPRDGLGRPLPYGAPGVDRQPEGVERSPRQALAEAQDLLDRGLPFHAHEVLEDAWKAAAEQERQLWRGLAQLAVGLTHAARGNAKGGAALLLRGAGAIAPYADTVPYDIDVPGLTAWAQGLADRLGERDEPVAAAGNAPRLCTGEVRAAE